MLWIWSRYSQNRYHSTVLLQEIPFNIWYKYLRNKIGFHVKNYACVHHSYSTYLKSHGIFLGSILEKLPSLKYHTIIRLSAQHFLLIIIKTLKIYLALLNYILHGKLIFQSTIIYWNQTVPWLASTATLDHR